MKRKKKEIDDQLQSVCAEYVCRAFVPNTYAVRLCPIRMLYRPGVYTSLATAECLHISANCSTCQVMGLREEASYLWDDSPLLATALQVVRVAPYVAMPPAQRQLLLSFLYRILPPEELEEDLVDFLLGAPPSEAALVRESSGELAYHVPCASELEPWSLPRSGVWAQVSSQAAASHAASRSHERQELATAGDGTRRQDPGVTLALKEAGADSRDLGVEGGLLSPVTPLDDLVVAGWRGGGWLGHTSKKSNSAPNLVARPLVARLRSPPPPPPPLLPALARLGGANRKERGVGGGGAGTRHAGRWAFSTSQS